MNKKVIELNQEDEYQKQLDKTKLFLEEMEDGLFTEMIELAIRGKWKTWADEQKAGFEFRFQHEMFKETGDENIDALFELMEEVSRVNEKIFGDK